MLKLFANTIPQNKRLLGYNETWYSAANILGKTEVYGIRTSEKTMKEAKNWMQFQGISIVNSDMKDFRWNPPVILSDAYTTQAYLIGPSLAIYKELKKKAREVISFPREVISIVSQDMNFLKKTAKKIHLPLERIVEAKDNALHI